MPLSNQTSSPARRIWLTKVSICLALAFGTLLIYSPVRNYQFLNYDDDDYVSDNSHVLGGFTRANVAYAFANFHSSNWHPVTWLSHMADVALWGGKNPGGHHITNVLLHSISSVLLFLMFSSMTGTMWRSAFVAAVFAWHPLHVESVAWVAERKDILCGLFWILTMAAYVGYAHRPSGPKYLLVVFLFVLGLMSKPMIVTLPLVLLLLDYWPLNRATLARADMRKWWRLFLEKAPLLVFALLVSRLTLSTQVRGGALKSAAEIPWQLRISNVPISYMEYLWKTVWPAKLAVFYPLPPAIPMWQALSAAAALAVLTIAALLLARRLPYLLTGWLWYLGTLIPVIGLIQVGSQAMADRYTYIPLVGLAMAGAWGMNTLLEKTRRPQRLAAFLFVVTTWLMIEATAKEIPYWQDSVTLFRRTIAVTDDNGIAHGNLSSGLLAESKPEEAAIEARKAIQLLPNHPLGYLNLGMAMLMQNRTADAIENLKKALQLLPDWPDTHNDLGGALILTGRVNEAIPHFYETLRLSPDHTPALKALAWIRATQPNAELRNANEALQLAEKAVRLTNGKDPQTLDVLAAALAEAGRFDEAITTAEQAETKAAEANKPKLADEIRGRVDLYRLRLPFRTRR